MNQPKVTVVTVVYNNEVHIRQCIESVLKQSYSSIEYVVIDGGSTDSTLSIIHEYRDRFGYFISEPDNGIGSAMNKGIEAGTGDYFIFLHSDDYFHSDDSVGRAVAYLSDNPDILLCDLLFGKNKERKSSVNLGFKTNFKTGVWHQGSLCSKNVFNMLGLFDTEIKIAMDYDFFLRAYRNGIISKKADILLSVMRDTGVSSRQDWPSLSARFSDEKFIHEKNCPSTFLRIVYKVYWALYLPYRRLKYVSQS